MSLSNKWVLVTGASSGIGRKTTEYLAQNGFSVYAGARKQEDIDSLNKIPNVTGVKLEVTSDTDIQNLLPEFEKTGLCAVVNNAGVAKGGPLMDFKMEDLKFQFEVNYFGINRITQAIFHFILKEK